MSDPHPIFAPLQYHSRIGMDYPSIVSTTENKKFVRLIIRCLAKKIKIGVLTVFPEQFPFAANYSKKRNLIAMVWNAAARRVGQG